MTHYMMHVNPLPSQCCQAARMKALEAYSARIRSSPCVRIRFRSVPAFANGGFDTSYPLSICSRVRMAFACHSQIGRVRKSAINKGDALLL